MSHWLDIVDYHVAGEALRVVLPLRALPGATLADKAQAGAVALARDRALATREPRGHRDLFAAFLTDPVSPGAAFGALICDGEAGSGWKATCGHGSIALAAAALELGWITAQSGQVPVMIDLPAGPVTLWADWDGRACGEILYRHVPSQLVDACARFGPLSGALVAAGPLVLLVDAEQQGIAPEPRAAFHAYRAMRDGCAAAGQVPPDLVQFHWPDGPRAFRSITFFGAAGYDRSPCGTATSALAAFCAETGKLPPGDSLTNTTLFGTTFRAGVRSTLDGLCPEIMARAFRTGQGRLCLAADDPLTEGLTAPDLF